MLVITRKFGQKVMIGNVVVTVVRRGWGGIVLGIDAPKGVRVDREEVRRAIEADRARVGAGAAHEH